LFKQIPQNLNKKTQCKQYTYSKVPFPLLALPNIAHHNNSTMMTKKNLPQTSMTNNHPQPNGPNISKKENKHKIECKALCS
jgi:hypothetical protein